MIGISGRRGRPPIYAIPSHNRFLVVAILRSQTKVLPQSRPSFALVFCEVEKIVKSLNKGICISQFRTLSPEYVNIYNLGPIYCFFRLWGPSSYVALRFSPRTWSESRFMGLLLRARLSVTGAGGGGWRAEAAGFGLLDCERVTIGDSGGTGVRLRDLGLGAFWMFFGTRRCVMVWAGASWDVRGVSEMRLTARVGAHSRPSRIVSSSVVAGCSSIDCRCSAASVGKVSDRR